MSVNAKKLMRKKKGRANFERIKFGSSPFASKMPVSTKTSCIKRIKLFLFLPYNKHLINRAKAVCMGGS